MTTDTNIELDDMKEIIGDFLVETDELLLSLDTNLVKLESAPDDLNLLNEIFRAAHTIKGTSSFLGFEQVTNLTHKMEDVLNKLRKGELKVTQPMMDGLLESLDLLKRLIEIVRSGEKQTLDLTDIIKRLEAEQEGITSGTPAIAVDPPVTDSQMATTRVDTPNGPAVAQAFQPDKAAPSPQARGGTEKKAGDQTIRVDVNRLDSLMNLMGELVLSRNSLVQTIGTINKEEVGGIHAEKLNHAAASVNYITTELQMAVMRMRMQPIGKVFSKFPRLVRDLSRDCQKQIDLVMFGEDTELDKSVIEEIGDPLVHIIRNSCDHGIELPDVRQASGKPAKGTIRLDASQEGSNIVIRIRDDGKGLDPDAIREKAIERGLGTRAEIDKMADKEIFRFIFEAGLSTAKVVTGVSGRGVGMDVVRTNIEKLNGQIELDSKRGAGTTITIKLPLTLAILQGLLVEADQEVYILPLSSVIETVRTEQADISYINQRPVLRLRDEIIPVISFASTLRGHGNAVALAEKPYVVVVGLAEHKLGINIDRFLGQEEVVIKSLGSYLGITEGVAGATILGDGRIRLIIDLIGLFNLARKKR